MATEPGSPPPTTSQRTTNSTVWHAMRLGRRVGIAIIGGAVTAVGVVLAVPLIPGPGFLVVLLGLGILSLEFEAPRIWLKWLKARGLRLRDNAQKRLAERRAARERRTGKP